MTPIFKDREVTQAWQLWNAFHEYAAILWEKYEIPFSEFLEKEHQPFEEPPELELSENDIPF